MQRVRHLPIDRNGIALWRRIEGILRHKILIGEYRIDETLPSESTLAAEYGVNRLTIRQAIRGLRTDGLVEQIQGRGTYVRSIPTIGSVGELTTARLGPVEVNVAFPALSPDPSRKIPHCSLIRISTFEAPDDVRTTLKPGETTVVCIERVVTNQGAPIGYVRDYLPHAIGDRITREDLANAWLTQVLPNVLGIPVVEAHQTISATVADGVLGEHLEVAFGTPLLYSERVYFGEDNQPLYIAKVWHRVDRFQYATTYRMTSTSQHESGSGEPR